MLQVRTTASAVIFAFALAGCSSQPPPHPVQSADEAIAIAKAAIKPPATTATSYRVESHKDAWVVWDGATPEQTHHLVIINRRTGKTSVGFYQVAYINEKL